MNLPSLLLVGALAAAAAAAATPAPAPAPAAATAAPVPVPAPKPAPASPAPAAPVPGPKTGGGYLPDAAARRVESGTASGRELVWSNSLRFANGKVTINWVQEKATQPYRFAKDSIEVQDDQGKWEPFTWQEQPDGSVLTNLIHPGSADRVRWIAKDPEVFAKEWARSFSDGQLARLAGTWSGPAGATLEVSAGGVRLGKVMHPAIAESCLEACALPRRFVCLSFQDAPTVLVDRGDRLDQTKSGGLCTAMSIGFEPKAEKSFTRNAASLSAELPPALVSKSFLEHLEAVPECGDPSPDARPVATIVVPASGLPESVVVKGASEKASKCLADVAWGLEFLPRGAGAPRVTVEVPVPASRK